MVYNGTCMREVTQDILADVTSPATGLVRPAMASSGSPGNGKSWLQSLEATYTFFQLQWAGNVPEGTFEEWREPGFLTLDPRTCKARRYDTSFANGSARS